MIDKILEQFNKKAQTVDPIGAKIKFVIDDNSILIDGTGDQNTISLADDEADTVISCSAETLVQLKNGELNPMMAVMGGKIKIKGDMGLAMKLQNLI